MSRFDRIIALAVLALLAACGSTPPAQSGRLNLKLAPATLGATIALQQHLKVERENRTDDLDAAVEIDADHVELVGLALGQRVLTLNYNGKELTSWRHVLLPSQVRAEDVLEDLQLTLWPADAIRAALPPGWRVEEEGLHRTLYQGDEIVATVDYSGMPRWSGKTVLDNRRYHYRLTVLSVTEESN
jgi:hypothetical protein